MKKYLLFFILYIPFLISCEKSNEAIINIDFIRPIDEKTFFVGDSINIQAYISSNEKIDYIEVSLVNSNQIDVSPSAIFHPETNSYSLNLDYEVSNRAITSGSYILIIEVSSNNTIKKSFKPINISAIHKKSKFLLAFSFEKNKNVHIYKIDSLMNYSELISFNGDFGGAAVNSFSQFIYCIGRYSGSLKFINANSGEIFLEYPANIQPNYPYFNCINYKNNLLTIGYYQGYIKGFFNTTLQKYSYIVENYRPLKVLYDGKYLICSLQYRQNNRTAIAVLFEISGMLNNIIETQFSIVDMFQTSQKNNIVIFTNSTNNSEIYLLNAEKVILTHNLDLPAGNISNVIQIDENNFIISYQNELLKYDLKNNTYSIFKNNIQCEKLEYDEINKIIYLSHGNIIESFSLSGTRNNSVELPDSIKDLHILYNI